MLQSYTYIAMLVAIIATTRSDHRPHLFGGCFNASYMGLVYYCDHIRVAGQSLSLGPKQIKVPNFGAFGPKKVDVNPELKSTVFLVLIYLVSLYVVAIVGPYSWR